MSEQSRATVSFFSYNKDAAAEVRRCVPLATLENEAGWTEDSGVSLLAEAVQSFAPMLLASNTARENAEMLFALAMEVGKRRPELFPAVDTSLVAANIAMIRCKEMDTKKVTCLDWALLPSALLLSGHGFQVNIPYDVHKAEASTLANIFARCIPGSQWTVAQSTPPKDAFILGSSPVDRTEADPGYLHSLSGRSGIFYCYWDFLDVALHDHIREQWLANKLIRSVLQLPRPRRQSVSYYPALIELNGHNSAGDSLIRLVNIKDLTRGPGGLAQDEVLGLLCHPLPKGCTDALDLRPEELRVQGTLDLKPSWHLARRSTPAALGAVRLADVAHIIRCQLPRTKVDAQEAAALAVEAAERASSFGGVMHDGSFVCREILLHDLDALTGFVKEYGNLTRVDALNPTGRQGKYLLRPDDILMAFRGAESSLGQVGFMEMDFETPAITGQSLCIIRPYNVDPVWLYYALQKATIRQVIMAQASGSKTLTVNLADLRNLPVSLPAKQEVDQIHARHSRIAVYIGEMENLREKVRGELAKVRHHFFIA